MPRGRGHRGHRSHNRSHHRSHNHVHYRGGRLLVITIPPTTDKTIVFPYNFSQKKFNTSHFNPAMTNNLAGSDEICQFLAEIERQLVPYHQAAGRGLIKLMVLGLVLLFIAGIIAIPVSILTKFSDDSTSATTNTGYSSYEYVKSTTSSFPIVIPIVFGILFVYVIIFIITVSVKNKNGRIKLDEAKQSVNALIAQRASDYKLRNLSWTVPYNFPHWIELWRLDLMQQQQQTPATGFYAGMPMQQPSYGDSNMYNASTDAMFSRPGETGNMMMMQPMQMQMQMQPMQMQPMQVQPVQVQMQPMQQGMFMQNQYGANTYANYNV